jgi:hypothetical protein
LRDRGDYTGTPGAGAGHYEHLHPERAVASAFRCSIVTPTAIAYEGEVTYVTFQAWDGQQGIMAGEAPLLAKMGIGRPASTPPTAIRCGSCWAGRIRPDAER